ncbi:serine/threonine-protein kinase LATS1, putative [Pediculus humanus corporis]|uniref:non-specific serine/threonine protein kinase n=1 Tax=Pediculus humanus subsp. corporis TaxID=121224 RepID=E0VPP6_PEDHC|nr:serine/threonine-protein kinase LATS1, putative [Pediculus humanus corporis]EEB15352.1 serine/threonine-protein kinase LATS1, putative [Pediculus humanus corporis]
MRKPSLERELCLHRGSPALDSGAGSSRSDSPHTQLSRQYSPSSFSEPPPPPPPRCSSTPPPPPPPHAPYSNAITNMQHLFKRMSPAPVVTPRPPAALPGSAGSTTCSGRQPMVVQNGPQVQQQLTQQMQALSLFQSSAPVEPPPPYPLGSSSPGPLPPPYPSSIQSRQSPTQDYRKSPSSGIYSNPNSIGSPSPITVSASVTPTSSTVGVARPTPLQAWGARQAKTQPPFIMQSVKSTQVQKPVLQTAIAPTAPQPASHGVAIPPPSYASSIQQKQQTQMPYSLAPSKQVAPVGSSSPKQPPASPVTTTASPISVPTTEPPSYASTMQALAMQKGMVVPSAQHIHHPLPPPPYSGEDVCRTISVVDGPSRSLAASAHHPPLSRKFSPIMPGEPRSDSPLSVSSTESGRAPLTAYTNNNSNSYNNLNSNTGMQNGNSNTNDRRPSPTSAYKVNHQSPIPERKQISKEKEEERRDCKVRNYSPQAYKFFMEQHVENVIKNYKQRQFRRVQLESEMNKIGLNPECQSQMRKMLSQKESNYIRLKRAKMDKSMFKKMKTIGVGAFGEVALVCKTDANHLYAMKTLRKADVLKRNQVAHVKAERDILAEADNEWVVKLYYSFQDKDNLYFVMDYIPGGDLMSLLIKLGVFQESLARFYIAELTCAIESVHKMGFIHRDIKPDNILIDKDGHIKLTDFGLCTGFRWTHNSKYYQRNGEHARQDSMDPSEDWNNECRCRQLKPLERRRKREHQRCLAHSLVGTPNYIAPEVLLRTGYTQLCDWWSVGVILYEMVVGSPPFLANTPAETQYKVINWEKTLNIPKDANLSPESTDLILKLCCGDDKRLGKNASEVKAHPFFKSIDFEKGLRTQTAPYLPRIQNPMDTSNFDPVDPDKLRQSGSSDSTKSDELFDNGNPFHGFFEFTFRRFFDDGGGPAAPFRISLDDNDNQGPVYV